MSLRLRLTALYTLLLGGVLLIFGTLVYGLVSLVLLDQIDTRLAQVSDQIIERLKVNAANQFDPRAVAGYQPTENLLFQVWDSSQKLQVSRPAGLLTPLDEAGLRSGQTYFSTQILEDARLRVLTRPLRTSRGPVGVLQVGLSLAFLDITQRTLASVLIILVAALMVLVGLGTWLLTGQALAPLAAVTRVATQITQADDLSRRIPLSGSARNEVGQLIVAFNDTLERLEKLFSSQRRFLADVSHELRTPLTVIKGEVGLMRLTGEVEEESLRSIELEVDRLTRLVGDLLLLAQAETGQLPLSVGPVELDTLLLEATQQMRTLAGERISIQIDEIDQVLMIGDQDRLKQVIVNLVANAIQYTPSGGKVNIALRKDNHQALLTVKDTGPGIPAADLPHIFERFYRAERSRKRSENSGFGLGLSIASWIVRRHGGTIEVESQEGKGTTFIVRLPLVPPQEKSG
jgi:heavy metal sensor kinase